MAAMELFSKKGFRGTTTRDLAYQAGVNEAIIFRHFDNKEALYSAILQHKAGESGDVRCEEIEKLAAGSDDATFFETIGRTFLERHERDSSFMRLLLFSALEGHELSEMFVTIMKDGPNISGNIKQIVSVNRTLSANDNYAGNPGHQGWGKITGYVCGPVPAP